MNSWSCEPHLRSPFSVDNAVLEAPPSFGCGKESLLVLVGGFLS